MKKRKHLSLEERSIIERLVQEGKSNKAIAEVLDRSKSTIGRELERNCWRLKCREYRSEVADGVAKKRRRHERKSRISEKIWQKIFEFCNEDWSPEQIFGALKLRGVLVSHETIYRRIYGEIRADWTKNICVGSEKTTATFAETTTSRSLEDFNRKPSESQF